VEAVRRAKLPLEVARPPDWPALFYELCTHVGAKSSSTLCFKLLSMTSILQ